MRCARCVEFDRWLDTLIPAEPSDELVAVFKAAWHAADEADVGPAGYRTEAGLSAVLAHLRGESDD